MSNGTPPPGIPERRQDCIDHENRIDEIAAELRKHGGWWKLIGAGLVVGVGYLIGFGSTINNKLDNIQAMLSKHEVGMERLDGRIKACETDILEIKQRHNFIDQSSVIKKGK